MPIDPKDKPILTRLRAALAEVYGDRLERVVLYGSRARGDAHEESDYDVAVFLRDMPDRIAELYRLADLATDILYAGGRSSTQWLILPVPTMSARLSCTKSALTASTCEAGERRISEEVARVSGQGASYACRAFSAARHI